jgi:hypothetical protein
MESSIYYNQIEQIKFRLIADIESEIKQINELVYFTNTFYYVDSQNSDALYSLYGIENGMVIADSALVGRNIFEVNSLPLEVILFVKKEIEYYNKSKIISAVGYLE